MNRKFVWILTVLLVACIYLAETQQLGKVYRIGVLTNAPHSTPEVLSLWEAFRQGLGERGWVEGQNLVIEYRWAEGQVERFPSLAAELVRIKVNVIIAVSGPGARAAKEATGVIPIVMTYVLDPVGQGLVTSLARPGGNITGLTFVVGPEIVGKCLELLKEAVPNVTRMALLLNPASGATTTLLKETQGCGTGVASETSRRESAKSERA
jgi:putative ABC transport system substrate-binding protein